ncbi:MAG: IPT/TIG domain-containing protein [Rikenellaceae bacterium]
MKIKFLFLLSAMFIFASCTEESETVDPNTDDTTVVDPDDSDDSDDPDATPAPSITSFSPSTAAVGETVTITGENFGTDMDVVAVTFCDNIAATVSSVANTTIEVVVPDGGVTGVITVTIDGEKCTSISEFEYPAEPVILAPEITALSVTEGYLGQTVTISGSNFGDDAEALTVKFGSVEAPVLSASDSEISVMIPDAAEDGVITVTKEGIEDSCTSADSFTYNAPSVRYMFDTDGDFEDWRDDTPSGNKEYAYLSVADGYLVLNYDWVNQTKGYNRLDIANSTAKLDADVNPIFAIKWDGVTAMSTFRMNIEGLGYYVGNTTVSFKVTGKKGVNSEVLYYNLTDGYGADLIIPTAANASSYEYIEFIATMKDTTVDSTKVDWVLTFASLEALDQYLAVTGD